MAELLLRNIAKCALQAQPLIASKQPEIELDIPEERNEFCAYFKAKYISLKSSKLEIEYVLKELVDSIGKFEQFYKSDKKKKTSLEGYDRLDEKVKFSETLESLKQLNIAFEQAILKISLTLAAEFGIQLERSHNEVDERGSMRSFGSRKLYGSQGSVNQGDDQDDLHADAEPDKITPPTQPNTTTADLFSRLHNTTHSGWPSKLPTTTIAGLPFNQSVQTVKPPKYKLIEFSGEQEDYDEFIQMFEEVIDRNTDITDMEKVLHLKSVLKGRAANVIRGIPAVGKNYRLMITSIRKKYGNQPANKSSIVEKLANLKPANNSPQDCDRVLGEISVIVNQMKAIGLDITKSADPLWINQLYAKFPNYIVEKVRGKFYKDPKFDIEMMLNTLETLIDNKMFLSKYRAKEEHNNSKFFEKKPQTSDTRHVLSADIRADDICALCEFKHPTEKCRKVTDYSEIIKILRNKRVCWKCWSRSHTSFQCQLPDCKCGRKHHPFLCLDNRKPNPAVRANWQLAGSQPNATVSQPQLPQNSFRVNNASSAPTQNAGHGNGNWQNHNIPNAHTANETEKLKQTKFYQNILMTVEGKALNERSQEYEKILVMFDTGAQRTLATEQLMRKLSITPTAKMEDRAMVGISGQAETFVSYSFILKMLDGYGKPVEIESITKPIISGGYKSAIISDEDHIFMENNNIFLANLSQSGQEQDPDIIIGIDYYSSLMLKECVYQLPSGLKIAKSLFGLLPFGRGKVNSLDSIEHLSALSAIDVPISKTEKQMVTEMFAMEHVNDQNEMKARAFYDEFKEKIRFEDGYVSAPFPTNHLLDQLPENFVGSKAVLKSVIQKLQKEPNKLEWYSKVINGYLEKDVIEVVNENVPECVGISYLPHHGVWNESKPTKPLRVVFNGSFKEKNGHSLNDVIDTGNVFVRKIPDILTKCRKGEIIILCDLQSAFTQVRLQEKYRDLCRFLWVSDVNKPVQGNNIVSYRFKRILFGSTASPAILNMVLTAFLEKENSDLAREILQSIYVDNILLRAETTEEALQKMKDIKVLFKRIDMNVREFITNREEINLLIADEDRGIIGDTKILGVKYSTDFDSFTMPIIFPKVEKLTKRAVLSQLHSVFDPLGCLIPAMVLHRDLMRECMGAVNRWSDLVPKELANKWIDLVVLNNGAIVRVARKLDIAKSGNTLLAFADASKKAIACCAYIVGHDKKSCSTILRGKAKLAPKSKTSTIPKMELSAIGLATEMAREIAHSLDLINSDIYIISDSTIALSWWKSDKKLPIFVTNRKIEIEEEKAKLELLGNTVQFFHTASENNVADIGTRGMDAAQIATSAWIHGPGWITENKWPIANLEEVLKLDFDTVLTITENESIVEPTEPITVLTATVHETPNQFLPVENYSSYSKVLRIVSCIGKGLKNWRLRAKHQINEGSIIGKFSDGTEICAEDMHLAEQVLIKTEQNHLRIPELYKRFKGKHFFKDDNGIIRMRSRLTNAYLPEDTKQPIFLQKGSNLAKLLARQYHITNGHCGSNHLLALMRARFFVNKPSSLINKCIKGCVVCNKIQGMPLGLPNFSQLPRDRLITAHAFEHTGVDLTGAFETKDHGKVYIIVYTCLVTRNVYLDIVENLTAAAFLQSFKRFISREGVPKLMRSDNGLGAGFERSSKHAPFRLRSVTTKCYHPPWRRTETWYIGVIDHAEYESALIIGGQRAPRRVMIYRRSEKKSFSLMEEKMQNEKLSRLV